MDLLAGKRNVCFTVSGFKKKKKLVCFDWLIAASVSQCLLGLVALLQLLAVQTYTSFCCIWFHSWCVEINAVGGRLSYR